VGLQMSSTGGVVEWVNAQAFGGYGIRIDGQDTKAFHNTVYSNDMWYYYGGYKGAGESLASQETSAATTGTTSSVSLSWAAVPDATGYAVYRGTSAGSESLFYITATNSFTDTGAASTSGSLSGIITTTVPAPGTITATPSSTGGTLAADTYYYKVTALGTDSLSLGSGWHGSIEFVGADVMSDWTEAYGLADNPTTFTYHHLADVLTGGGYSHFDHIWAQLGQVGIAQPYGYGIGDTFENIRIDFARLEGFWTNDVRLRVIGGNILSSCVAPNALTINTGQGGTPAGTCNQFFNGNDAMSLSGVTFSYIAGFGPTYETADVYLGGANSTYHNLLGGTPFFQTVPGVGAVSGNNWEPIDDIVHNISGAVPDVRGLYKVYPNDSTPTTYYGFLNVQLGQDFYVLGGNANVTLHNNPPFLLTCTGQDINMGGITGFLHFHYYGPGIFGVAALVREECDPQPAQPTIASSETVTFSATPTFATTTRASIITLTDNVAGFTLAAGTDGQEKTLTFCQNETGEYTVTAPSNVHGFFMVGTTANKCSSQHFTYSTAQAAWLADSPGVANE
jgi:hypothetical protein